MLKIDFVLGVGFVGVFDVVLMVLGDGLCVVFIVGFVD